MNLPKEVTIVEVGPRDGFQSIKEFIPTKLKLQIIEDLIKANFQKIEITSFVSPKAIPQMKDAKEITEYLLKKYPDKKDIFHALVPNLYGAKAAYEAGLREITYVISTSVSHNKANVRRSREESFNELKEIKTIFPAMKIKFAVATVFGCPYEGDIKIEEVKWMIQNGLDIGVEEFCLADTIGVANPLQIEEVLGELKSTFNDIDFSLHLHDTRGMGLANVIAALNQGVTKFESAVGGLGGCPFAPGAAGNIASEDLINMLECMGVNTGVNLDKVLSIIPTIMDKIKPILTSHLAYTDIKCEVGDNNE